MVGTAVGAVAIVLLTVLFVQDRIGFLLGLVLWGAACGFVATLLRNFASYGAALAGITAAIIASDEVGAVGGANGDVLILAVTRASEICIGIVCAGVVLAGTDFGGARHRLAAELAAIASEITERLAGALLLAGPEQLKTRLIRYDFIRRVAALDPVIDEVLGDSSDLRPHSPVLQAAAGGLFAALSGWRAAAVHLDFLGNTGRREAGIVLENIPLELRSVPVDGKAGDWAVDPARWRKACTSAVRALIILPADTPSLRLLADRTAEGLIGIRRALDGLMFLVDPTRSTSRSNSVWFSVPDLLPAFMNAARIFVTMGAVELFWIATAWPNGAQALVFATIAVILFSPRANQAYSNTMSFMIGACAAAVLAAIINFAVLPGVTTFAGFSLAIGLVLVPIGMLMAPWPTPTFMAMGVILLPLIAPENNASYDTQQFYNSALADITGIGAAALAFRLVPQLSAGSQTRRLLALTLRDLRRLLQGSIPRTVHGWEGRIYSRLLAMPEQAEPLQRAQLLSALSVGTEAIRLRRLARRFDLEIELEATLEAVALGDSILAIERFGRLDLMLAAVPGTRLERQLRLRARGSVLAVSEALARHAAYFDSGAA
jgi:uncharacterized membrane protein YccC